MTFDPYADHFRIADPKALFAPSSASTPPSVKSESSSSPLTDLSPSPLPTFSFSYPIHSPTSLDDPKQPALYDTVLQDSSAFRFSMAHPQPHPPDSWSLKRPQQGSTHGASVALELNTLSFLDDYEDADDLSDLPGSAMSGSAAHATQSERIIRRRSSKGRCHPFLSVDFHSDLSPLYQPACDQCRKSKCKCERVPDGGPCKSCIMLGTRESIISFIAPRNL